MSFQQMISLIFSLHYFKFTLFILLVTLRTNGATIPEEVSTNVSAPAHFVLVHGASFGGWCWYKLRTLLESAGYKVSSPDLKSAGIDPTDANTIFTFQEYNQPLHDILASLPENEKVYLVGHSFGGFSITDAIKNFPEKIEAAVYVAAAMVHNPLPIGMGHKYGAPPPMDDLECFFKETDSFIPTSCIYKPELQHDLFFNKSPLQDSTLGNMLLKPFPFRAFLNFPFPGGLKDVPRVFVKTLNDNLFNQFAQDAMILGWPPSHVFTIPSDHLAMISKPSELFDILVEIASKYNLSSSA